MVPWLHHAVKHCQHSWGWRWELHKMLVPGFHPQDPSWVMMGPGHQNLGHDSDVENLKMGDPICCGP